MPYTPKISPNLLTPANHSLFLIDYESQMLFPLKSINTGEFRDNVGIVAGASKIFNVPTVVTTVAESSFSGPVFPELEEFYPKATGNHIDRTTMNAWEDEPAYNAIVAKGRKKIVFGGLWTSVCIVEPVLCAITEGFDTYVITDACGDVSPEAHQQGISRMVQAGTTPMTSIQYLLELQRDWARQETYAAVTTLIQKYGGSYGIGIHYANSMLAH
jgi:nicotinamidase-related amidase